jgi:hypothetical protein
MKALKRLEKENYTGVFLSKTGQLFRLYWSSKIGKTVCLDVSSQVSRHLLDVVRLEDGVTLSVLYDVLSRSKEAQVLLSSSYAKDQLREYRAWRKKRNAEGAGLKKKRDPHEGPTELIVSWTLDYFSGLDDYQKEVLKAVEDRDQKKISRLVPGAKIKGGKIILPPGTKKLPRGDFIEELNSGNYDKRRMREAVLEVSKERFMEAHLSGGQYPDFKGLSTARRDDEVYKKGEIITWGFGEEISEYFGLPIRLSSALSIYPSVLESKTGTAHTFINPSYSLLQVLEAIVREFGFYGDSKSRSSFWKKLKEAADEVSRQL